ncbi:hypothetical protein QYE76_011444 [Lolium multiflorum]|uniref:Uncharacterized protein n=1 Tax=Lolium multiflorum TaxID=4521 RepID=A0AAD8TXE9_LOLMU|nr:hypothetical protein QYE76_011444 [Lolium multiflorum]
MVDFSTAPRTLAYKRDLPRRSEHTSLLFILDHLDHIPRSISHRSPLAARQYLTSPPTIGAAQRYRSFVVVHIYPEHTAIAGAWLALRPLEPPASLALVVDDDEREPLDRVRSNAPQPAYRFGSRLTVGLHWEAKLMGEMEPANVKFYQLGNGGDLIFERDLDRLSDSLGRPHPEFHGVEANDQHGGELQWITADLRGKVEPPTSERILFTFRESSWLDGLAHPDAPPAEAPCGPSGLHVVQTQKELDNSRGYANQTHFALTQHGEAIKMLNKDRKSLRLQRAKKDATIERLRAKIAALELTVKTQEDQLRELEDDDGGIDLQGGEAFLGDDDDFEEEEEDPEAGSRPQRMGSFPSMWTSMLRSSCTRPLM